MPTQLEQINGIYKKLLLLQDKIGVLENDNNNYKQINKKLKEDLEKLSNEKVEMEASMLNVEQNTAKSSSELFAYKKNVQKEIDFYIKKVDKCISLVNQS